MENIGGIIIENMSMPQKGKVRVLVLRDDGRCVDEFGNVYKVIPVNRGDRQPMYEELVKELRKESCGAKTTSWWRAADAIEELEQMVEHYKGCSDDWYKEACDYKAMLPRWVSVTERLPKPGRYLVCRANNYGGDNYYRTDIISYSDNLNKIDRYDFHGKEYKRPGWFDYDSEYGHFETGDDIIAWMPLPEPPKEATE